MAAVVREPGENLYKAGSGQRVGVGYFVTNPQTPLSHFKGAKDNGVPYRIFVNIFTPIDTLRTKWKHYPTPNSLNPLSWDS